MFIVKHPGLFHSHSTVNIPGKLSENARSLLYDVSLLKKIKEKKKEIEIYP